MISPEDWMPFLAAGGRVTIEDWRRLEEPERLALAEAGLRNRADEIASFALAVHDRMSALALAGDKEAIEDHLAAKCFEAWNEARDARG